MQKFIPQKVVEKIRSEGLVNLSTNKKNVSILFSDIRGFSKKSADVPAEVVTAALNIYLSEVNKIIYGSGGFVDKYLGDGILAVFNLFSDCPEHEVNATIAATKIQNAMPYINEKIRTQVKTSVDWATWEVGIAIHSGDVISGLIGTSDKLEFTVIGDTVNVASRLCELAREYKSPILVSPEVANKIKTIFKLTEINEVTIRGHGRIIKPSILTDNIELRARIA